MSATHPGARPRVSVLIPVHDAQATLAGCLRSVLRQSETDWECVVVDDGSQDGSRAIAAQFAAGDPRFIVLPTPHAGIVAALNAGLARCRGHFVARMDADDWMHRDRLRLQLAALQENPKLAGVGCHVRLFPRASIGPGLRDYECWLNGICCAQDVRREAFVECPLAHPTLLLRHDVLKDHAYRDRGWPEDYDLLLRLLHAGHELGTLPQRLVGWRNTAQRLSLNHPHYAIDRFTACKAAFLAQGLLKAEDDYILWGYGATGRAMRRALAHHGKQPCHIVELHPRRLGEVIHAAPVIPPDALPQVPRRKVVISVAGPQARSEIRADLARFGFRELDDFVCTA